MKIKKTIATAALCLLSCILCACQQTDSTKSDTANGVETDATLPELHIGADILKPFFYIDENGDYAGIDADIAVEACRRAGYAPVFVEVSWVDRDSYLNEGTVDCLWSAFIKDGREDAYLWTDTYLQSNLRAIVDSQSPDQDLDSLNTNAGMAVRAGSKLEYLLLHASADHPSISVYSCGTFSMAETAFVKGYIGALGGHEAVLQEVMNSYPGLYRFLDGSMMSASLGVAFRKDDTSDRWQKINTTLREMKADGTISAIYDSYASHADDQKEVPAHAS